MTNNYFRTLLVIGNNHESIAKKYSADHTGEPIIRYKKCDANKLHETHVNVLTEAIKNCDKDSSEYEYYNKMLRYILEMTDDEYFEYLGDDTAFDFNENGDIITHYNVDAPYQFEKCYDKRIREDQRNEAPFCLPFILKDGMKVYSAKKGDIDWDKVHMANTEIYENAWDICVNGKKPVTEEDKLIYDNMCNDNTKEYFSNFKNKWEYVTHNCAFWTYAIATEEEYISGEDYDSITWATKFYDTVIKPLPDDTMLTIYEIKLIE